MLSRRCVPRRRSGRAVDDPFFGPEPVAPAPPPQGLPDLGVYPEEEPATIQVNGTPVPWAMSKPNPKTGARFVPTRQLAQADQIVKAWDALGMGLIPKPYGVVVGMTFTVPRPKSHYGSGKNSTVLKPDSPDYPTGRPDLSNLVKLVEDALTGVAWDDDDQVVLLRNPQKRFAGLAATLVQVWLAPGRLVDRARRTEGYDAESEDGQLALT